MTRYTVVEILEGVLGAVSAVVVGAATLPGFLLTVPAIALALAPVIMLGAVVGALTLAAALVSVPVVVGAWAARRAWRARPALHLPSVPALHRRERPTAGHPAL